MAKPRKPQTEFAARLNEALSDFQDGEELASRLGISFGALQNYRRGVRKPNIEFLENLKELTDVRVDWLLTGEGLMFDETPPKLPDGAPINVDMQSKYIKPIVLHLARVQKKKQIHLEPDLIWWIISSIHNALLEEHHGADVDSDEFNELLTELIDKQLEKGGW